MKTLSRKAEMLLLIFTAIVCWLGYISTYERLYRFDWLLQKSNGNQVKVDSPWWESGECLCNSTGYCSPLNVSVELSAPARIPSSFGTCSRRAAADGPHQRVVAFPLYGNDLRYWRGLSDIIVMVKKIYPGWKVWLYTNPRGHSHMLCPLLRDYDSVLRICDVTNLPAPLHDVTGLHNMLWRAIPLGDPYVDALVVRDSDALMTEREKSVIEEWLNLGKMFHVMRDHPYHGVPILGGMWGARWDERPYEEALIRLGSDSSSFSKVNPHQVPTIANLTATRDRLLKEGIGKFNKGVDQTILAKVLWPVMVRSGSLVSHDSFFCKSYPQGFRPFPTKRPNNTFIGNARYISVNKSITFPYECPVPCRPPKHPDWRHC